jgi:hypothetical protein
MGLEYNDWIIPVTQLCVMYIRLALLGCGGDDMCTFPVSPLASGFSWSFCYYSSVCIHAIFVLLIVLFLKC